MEADGAVGAVGADGAGGEYKVSEAVKWSELVRAH
jgi:hypothetical protein